MTCDNVACNCFGDRQRFAPWGMEGGLDGEPGGFWHISAETGEVTRLSAKTTGFPLKKNDIIRVHTPGAGGVGDPAKRAPEKVLADVVARKISCEAAEKIYGVRVVATQNGSYELAK